MNDAGKQSDIQTHTELLRAALKSQYHATLAMLRETIESCPEELWLSEEHLNSFWQIAYHALFFAHAYMQPSKAAFSPWEHQQSNVQHPDCIPGPPDPNSTLPLIPNPYTKEQVLAYWNFCEEMVDKWCDALDLHNPDSGFLNYKMPKLEHQIVNIRHIEHHMAQLADRLRSSAHKGVKWVRGVTPR